MSAVVASAPGKIVLFGEYAVLDGAAAMAMAIDRRAAVSIEKSGESLSTVIAPGHSSDTGRFDVTDGRLQWQQGGDDYELFESIWSAAGIAPATPLSISLDTGEFRHGTKKLGVGSSAALSVALAAGLARVNNADSAPLEIATMGHRAFQGGVGSGIDVATSNAGGLLVYGIDAPQRRTLSWPDGLYFAILWSGVEVDTSSRIQQFSQQPISRSRSELGSASERLIERWLAGNATEILSEISAYVDVLQRFSSDYDLAIFDAGHSDLVDIARSSPLVYKPCGAGGGDIGIVLGDDKSSLDDFVTEARKHRFEYLQLNVDSRGVETSGYLE